MPNDPKDDNELENKENSDEDQSEEAQDNSDEPESEESESDNTVADASGVLTDDGADETVAASEDPESEVAEAADEIESNATEGEVEVAEPEMTSEPPVVAAASSEQASGGKSGLALVFGGLVAGGIGFLAATFSPTNGTAPDNSSLLEQLAAANEGLISQTTRSDALQSEIESLKASLESATGTTEDGEPFDAGPLNDAVSGVAGEVESLSTGVADISAGMAEIQERIIAIDERLTALEARPITSTPDGGAAMEAQLLAFREELDAVTAAARAEIEASQERASMIEAEAAAAEALANKRAALAAVTAALESGGGFDVALQDFPDAPVELTGVAKDGVATLASLQASFPSAARTALSMAEAAPEDASAGERLAAFMRRQTNARSLAPREGDSADAVLSRAEAALNQGDLPAAIAELDALSDGPKSAMGAWVETAKARAAAVSAADSLLSVTN